MESADAMSMFTEAFADELRGAAGADERSAALSSVSVQPPPARVTPVVFVRAAAALAPSWSAAPPQPTRSAICELAEQLPAVAPQVSAVASRTSAILPPEF